MNYLLDTNICVYFMRGKRNVAAKISEIGQEHFFISEMTLGNYFMGLSVAIDLLRTLELFMCFASM